jgi:hypothetical protein
MDCAWDLDSAVDVPAMSDGSPPNRVPLPVFARVAGSKRDDYYNVYSILQMFCDVSHDWSAGRPLAHCSLPAFRLPPPPCFEQAGSAPCRRPTPGRCTCAACGSSRRLSVRRSFRPFPKRSSKQRRCSVIYELCSTRCACVRTGPPPTPGTPPPPHPHPPPPSPPAPTPLSAPYAAVQDAASPVRAPLR